MSDKMWFQPCTDEKHPRGPHLHLLDGVTIEVTDEAVANAANTLAFPETDEKLMWYGSAEPLHNCHALPAFKARVATLLRKIEWSRHIEGTGAPEFDPEWDLCDFCEAVEPGPHRDDCDLAALLREAQS